MRLVNYRLLAVSIPVLILLVAYIPTAAPLDGVRTGGCWTDLRGVNHCGGGDPTPVREPIYREPIYREPEPEVPRLTPEQLRAQRAQVFYRKGFDLWQLGKHLAAEPYFVKAFSVDPDGENVRAGYCAIKNTIGVDFLHQKNYVKARQYYQAALSACPSDSMVQDNLRSLDQQSKIDRYNTANQLEKSRRKVSISQINGYLDSFADAVKETPNTLGFASLEDSLRFPQGSPNPEKKAITPAPVQKGVKFKEVPLPPGILSIEDYLRKHDPFGGGPEGTAQTMDLILGALKAGNGSLEDSYSYLKQLVREKGDSYHGMVALSYLDGLRTGAIGFKSGPTDAQLQESELIKLLTGLRSAGAQAREKELTSMLTNAKDSEQARKNYENELRVDVENRERLIVVLDALRHGGGDLYKSMEYLKNGRLKNTFQSREAIRPDSALMDAMQDNVGWGAYYYMLGLSAYPGLKGENAKGDAK